MIPGAPSGHWVRTRNEESAKLFVAEQEQRRDLSASRRRIGGKLASRLGFAVLAVALLALAVMGVLASFGG